MTDSPSVSFEPSGIPEVLKGHDQWVCWNVACRECYTVYDIGTEECTTDGCDGEPSKVPVSPHDGRNARSNDSDTWATFDKALTFHGTDEQQTEGLGYMFDAEGTVVGLDLDNVRDPDTGELEPWAKEIVDDVDSWTEVSASGTGLHIFALGFKPGDACRRGQSSSFEQFDKAELEMYDGSSGRYFAVTGEHVDDTPTDVEQRNDAVQSVYEEYLTDDEPDDEPDAEPAPSAEPSEPVDMDDAELIEKAKNADNGDAFARLWEGDTSAHSGDHSRARMALLSHLAFWTAGDSGRMDTLYRESGLHPHPKKPGKWDRLGDDEIQKAIRNTSDYYEPDERPSPVPRDDAGDIEELSGWAKVRAVYGQAENVKEVSKGPARLAAADQLERDTDWMYVIESEVLWKYNADRGVYVKYGTGEAAEMLKRELGAYFSSAEKREVLAHLRANNRVHRSELNARGYDDPLLCVGNGVVNLATGDLVDHSSEYRFIRGLKWDYSPDGADTDRSRIIDFLDDVTERVADRDTFLDHLAHGLMPGHPYRAFVVAYGPGGNGKSQVAKIFSQFVGSEHSSAVGMHEMVSGSFGTGALPGSFINWDDDMAGDGGGALTDVTLLKKATGGSEIRANAKYERIYDFENEAAMFFSANEPPRFSEQKDSISQRIYPIRMPYKFLDPNDREYESDNPMHKEKVPGLGTEIAKDDAAMRGLLALAVEHAQRLIANRGRYSQPESPTERLEKYNKSADPIVRFSRTALDSAGPEYMVRKDDVYRIYRSFTDSWSERSASEDGFKGQFTRTFGEEVEDARTRTLATDDDAESVYCWKRLKWSPAAREQMPDWMVDRYADHFEDESGDLSGESTDTTAGPVNKSGPLGPSAISTDVMSTDGRLPPIAGVVTSTHEDRYGNPAGRLSGDDGGIDFTEVGDATRFDTPARVRITDAKLTKNELGALELEFDPTTDIEQLDDDGGSSPTADAVADGGTTDIDVPADAVGPNADARRIAQFLDMMGRPLKTPALRTRVTIDRDMMSPARYAEGIERALEEGLVQETDDGYVANL